MGQILSFGAARVVPKYEKGSANSITKWDPDFYGYALDDLYYLAT